jgi:hypothetical protein
MFRLAEFEMRYKLWHLMLLVTLIALALKGVDVYCHRTVTVRFSDPNLPPLLPMLPPATLEGAPLPQRNPPVFPEPETYILDFQAGDEEQPISGTVLGKFGPNTLFGREIRPGNLGSLDGATVQIRYRHRSLPWLPATRIEDEIGRHFETVLPAVETDQRPPWAWMAEAG